MGNFHVNKILEETKITDFLSDNGIHPVKKSGEKLLYSCPIHSGDNTPSFIVYPVGTKGRSYQTYHCFGCHSGINIINLKSDLDKVSSKEAIRFFLKDIDIDPVDAQDSVITENIADINSEERIVEDGDKQIELLMMLLNSTCRDYLCEHGDENEVKFFDDNFYKKIDEMARGKDIETLEAYYDMIIDNNVLENRAETIRRNQEEEETSASNWIL